MSVAEKAEKLVFAEIEKLKNGEFSDKDLEIIKTEIYRQRQEGMEDYRSRVFEIVGTFSEGSTWEEFLRYSSKIENISREEVIRVARLYLGNNYYAIHSKMGFPKKETLEKPGYEAVQTDQKEESGYAEKFKATIASPSTPKFLKP